MKLDKSMEMDHILGKGVYLKNINDDVDIIFVDRFYKEVNKFLKRNSQYVLINHPEQINYCITKIVNVMFSSFSKEKNVEHSFNGVIEVYNNIIYLRKVDDLLQVVYFDTKVKSVILSSNYKLNNLCPEHSIMPTYRTCQYGYNFYFAGENYTISEINQMVVIANGK